MPRDAEGPARFHDPAAHIHSHSDDDSEEGGEEEGGNGHSASAKAGAPGTDSEDEEEILLEDGKDGRTPIDEPWRFPHSIHGHMRINILGRSYIGSGTLIGDRYVLTAGHNVFFRKFNSAPDSIEFFPGLHGTQVKWRSRAENFFTHPTFADVAVDKKIAKLYDIGLVVLKDP